MSSPWATIQPLQEHVSLADIMSEETARDAKKKMSTCTEVTMPTVTDKVELFDIDGTDNDEVIAHTLQAQFNREYDLMLKRTEEKFNGDAKVGISYCNYRTAPDTDLVDRNPDIDDENRDWDRFVSVEKEYASIPRCGYKKIGEGSSIVTKHDMLISSRINACRVLNFPPGIETGDAGGFDMKLNNKVFNSLRAHNKAHCYRQRTKARQQMK